MGYYNEIYSRYRDFDFDGFFRRITTDAVLVSLAKDKPNALDFLTFLSPAAEHALEEMAQRAHSLTVQNFGRVIFLFTPLYLSDYCENQCTYCGFNANNIFARKKLTPRELDEEAGLIAKTELKHILILTGESRSQTPPLYIKECVQILKKYFSSVSLEIYPLDAEEYRELIAAGVDGLTIYQEVYNEVAYENVHPAGPKKHYHYRLDAPERGCRAGMRTVTLGPLLGLDDWRKEAFFAAIHADYLQSKYPDVEVGLSFPRLRPHLGNAERKSEMPDRGFVQVLLASRLFLPRAGITVSTREEKHFRDNILPLGVTKMSAASSTEVGGRLSAHGETAQFEICDRRSVEEMKEMLASRGYMPVFKDWHALS